MPNLPDPVDWRGFDPPRYTPVPDAVFDVWMPRLTCAEFKVLCYICRRTFGFKKDADDISTAQMVGGIKRRDGSVLDDGTGLSESAVKEAVRGLISRGLIYKQHNTDSNGGSASPTYRLILRGEEGGRSVAPPGALSDPPPRVLNAPPGGRSVAPQETVVQDTENKSGSGDEFPNRAPGTGSKLVYSPWIADVIVDYSRELGDLANSSLNVEQALRLWQSGGLREEPFVELLRQAKLEVRKGQGSRSVGANKMQAFFRAVTALAASGGS